MAENTAGNGQKVLKVDVLSDKVIKLEADVKELSDELGTIKVDQARHQERVTLYQIGQTALTMALSTVAAIFGGVK